MSITKVDSLLKPRTMKSTFNNNNVDDDDLYSGYDSMPPEYNVNDLIEDEEFQEALKSVTWGKRSATPKPPGTASWRIGTSVCPAKKI